MESYVLINYFRLIKEFDRELKDEEAKNTSEVNKQLNDEKQSMVSIWNLLYFSLCLVNIHMHNGDMSISVRSVIHDVKWWAAYFFSLVPLVSLILSFLLMKLFLMWQYFLFADQRAEFICSIEKNVSWLVRFPFRGHEFASVLSCVICCFRMIILETWMYKHRYIICFSVVIW